jgi:hypothetical protein
VLLNTIWCSSEPLLVQATASNWLEADEVNEKSLYTLSAFLHVNPAVKTEVNVRCAPQSSGGTGVALAGAGDKATLAIATPATGRKAQKSLFMIFKSLGSADNDKESGRQGLNSKVKYPLMIAGFELYGNR